jgi:hypothetical protein
MQEIFAAAIDDIYGDANMAEDVTYLPVSGQAVSVRAVVTSGQAARDLGDVEVVAARRVVGVRRKDLSAKPRQGDTIARANGETLHALEDPELDDLGLEWRIRCGL